MTKLLYPECGSIQSLHTEGQKAFVKIDRQEIEAIDFDYLNLQYQGEDDTFPLKIQFIWETDDQESEFLLSESPDFKKMYKHIRTQDKSVVVSNLKVAQIYYWRVNDSEVFTFTTEDEMPRWIGVDGLYNVRDNGGWKTMDGRRMRQGILYRGSEMECASYHDRDVSKASKAHLTITESGIRTLREELGIRTDLELRISARGYLLESPLGADVDLQLIPVVSYGELFKEEWKPTVKQIFELLADPSVYPLYYHCWGGADRTATIAYLLEALLGVGQEELYLDYELTTLAVWGARSRVSDRMRSLEDALLPYDPEGTPQSRTIHFLKSCGVSEETLQTLRDIYLE